MSIPALIQTYDEMRRLALAGSVVAPGDFRLKRLVPTLEQAGQKAPVFARVAEAVERLAESSEQTSAGALLELASLVSSILYTQGETGVEGEWAPLRSVELGRFGTGASARVLKPLQEALTTTGSGRLEIIRDGFERGAFQDLRLVAPALAALDDSHAGIADLIAQKVLPTYGAAIVPELEAAFDPRGRGGHVRRLVLMHRLDPKAARPHVLRCLEEGSQEARVAAIGCLGDSTDDLPLMMEQARSKARDVRTAALAALGRSGADEAARVLCDCIPRDDLGLAIEALRRSRHPAVVDALLDEAEKQYNALIGGKEKDAKKRGQQVERTWQLLECLRGRDDPRTEQLLLGVFVGAERLAAIKGSPGGSDVVERLVDVMKEGSPRVRDSLIDAHDRLPAESLGHAFAAARRSRTAAEVFAIFSPCLTAGVSEKKKNRDPAWLRRQAVIEQLVAARNTEEEAESSGDPAPGGLDPRWLDLAVKLGNMELVRALAVPRHAGAIDLLSSQFRQWAAKPGKEFEAGEVLETMVHIGHPEATDALIQMLKKFVGGKTTHGYYGLPYWIGRLIPDLPGAEAVPKLEALLPTLPEKLIDMLLDRVAELKRSTTTATSS